MEIFDSALLVFTIPALFSIAFWLLGLAGLFDFDALDADVDGVEPGLLGFAGAGLVPMSVVLSLLLFFFGWTGIGLHLAGESLFEPLGWGAGAQTLVYLLPSALVSLFASAGTARLVRPLFDDYGEAKGAVELVGRVAVVNSSTVSPTFGSAEVTPVGGIPIEIAVRTESGAAALYGDRVLIIDYDPAHGTYTIAPYDTLIQPSSDDLALPSRSTENNEG